MRSIEENDSREVCMLSGGNYKVDVTVGRKGTMLPLRATLDTGAAPNLINQDALPADWLSAVRPVNILPFISASKHRLAVRGVLRLTVRIGHLRANVDFFVVPSIATPCILGTTFSDRFVQGIFPQTRKVTFTHGGAVSIVSSSAKPCRTIASQRTSRSPPRPRSPPKGLTPKRTDLPKVYLAKTTRLPARTTILVSATADLAGLHYLRNRPDMMVKHGSLMANGVVDVSPHRPFQVAITNFMDSAVTLPKGMRIANASPCNKEISTIFDVSSLFPLDDGVAHSTEGGVNLISDEADKPEDGSDQEPPWQEQVNIGEPGDHLKDQIIDLLSEFKDLWSGRIGRIRATKHRIELTPGAQPVHQAPYRAGHKNRDLERKEIEKMLAAGVIEPAQSEWASPVVIVPKKGGDPRFCVDYRKLNAVTVRDSYPLPRMDECIDSLGDARVFTTLDALSGYWQIDIADEDRDKTAFTSHHGLYRYTRMPFGLRNAPATFQRAIDIILSRVKWRTALVYLDDIIVYSPDAESHFDHLKEVLQLLHQAGITLKLKKCQFFQDKVEYLGHIIQPGQLRVNSHTTEGLKHCLPPTNQTELRSFLGMCNVYRRFVPNFARIAAPLSVRTGKNQPSEFQLDEAGLEAFNTLREHLLNPPVLALPRYGEDYVLDTDACKYQVGCCLLQRQPDTKLLHPVGYFSRTLTKEEKTTIPRNGNV